MSFLPFYRRRFLNLRGHEAGAYVLADVSLCNVAQQGTPHFEVAASFTVADCSRVATLTFHTRNASDARNALHKARTLKDVLDRFIIVSLERAIEASGVSERRG